MKPLFSICKLFSELKREERRKTIMLGDVFKSPTIEQNSALVVWVPHPNLDN